MAWFERDHMCIDPRFLNANLTEQFGKSATGFAAQAGKDFAEQSDQALGRGGSRIEVPRGQVPLLQDQ